jgi:hypothetical protein
MATIDVKDAGGNTVAIEKPLAPGRSAAATSRPVALSNEDAAYLDGIETLLTTIDGRVDGLETLITSTNTKLDTAITALQIIDNMVLAAGTANIGDVDVLTLGGQTPAFGSGANGATVLRTALATDSPGVIATGTAGTASATVLTVQGVASMTPVATVGKSVTKTITMTADTAIMASADIIADTQQMDAAFRVADGTGVINSVTVFDPDDNAAFAFDVYVHRTTTSMGSENAGITITDANAAAGIIGVVSFATTDAKDLINGRMYHKSNLGLVVSAVSGTDDLYFSIVNGSGTPTFGGGSIPMVVGILQD